MNILYYLDYFPKISESFILNEIYHLAQQGHRVAVFSLNKPDANIYHDELEEINIDIQYAHQPSATSVPSIFIKGLLDSRLLSSNLKNSKHRFGARYLMKQCLDFVDSLDYEINHVHTHFARWNKVPAALVAEIIGVDSSLTTHAYDLYASPDKETLEITCNTFDFVFTISRYNKQFIDVEIDPEARTEVVRMGIRTEKFKPTNGSSPHQLLTICRFIEKKGIEYAIQAVAQCVEEYPDIEYRLVGSGPRRQKYEMLISKLGIEDNVTFLGKVSDEQLIHELDKATAFILPCVVAKDGDRDGIPVTIMEAMAMETPPISTQVSGIPELIDDEETGFICSERSVNDIEQAINYCFSKDLDSIGKKANKTIKQNHEISVVGSKLEMLFSN